MFKKLLRIFSQKNKFDQAPSNVEEEVDKNGFFELNCNGEVTFIVFGGIMQGVGLPGLPPFEFARSLQEKGYNVLFVRDIEQAWYHFGVKGMGDSIPSVIENIKERIPNLDKCITMGNSMGGYASLLFGHYLDTPIRLAFSPQTFMDQENRHYFNENRWAKQIASVHRTMPNAATLDLSNILTNTDAPLKKGKNYIFYGKMATLDKIHAERLKTSPSTDLYEISEGTHQLAKLLRETGLLEEIIKSSAESIIKDNQSSLNNTFKSLCKQSDII